jgi:methylene-tetrahydromethanopterin dehydrogenase
MGEEKVLELKPLKGKKLDLIMIESEFPIEWFFNKERSSKNNLVWDLNIVSKEYLDLVEKYLDKYEPDFAVEEKGNRNEEAADSDPLKELFERKNILYKMVDISENAEDYLRATLDQHNHLISQLSNRIEEMIKANNGQAPKDDPTFQELALWRDYLQTEYDNQEDEVRYKVREAWMMMKIINLTKTFKKNQLKGMFICDLSHFRGIKELAEELNINSQQIKLERKVKVENNPILINNEGRVANAEVSENKPKPSLIELSGIKIKTKDKSDKICYFFDTDDNASPFDINMAYDAGFDVVVPISRMTADKVPQLVQDAIFSRKPKAPTTFFIGGANVKEGEEIARKVTEALVPPFECPVIIDPRGSHTTASSVVAKTMHVAAKKHGMESIEGKKVVIMGAGPVARIAAILAAKLKARPFIVETWDKGSLESIKNLANDLKKEAGEDASDIVGVFAPSMEERVEVAKDADIIWSLAAAGVEIFSAEAMNQLKGKKIVVDINLVPPYGIEGIRPKHDNEEIYPGIFGIGALALGRLKSETEASILKESANTRGKKIFNYDFAFEKATEIITK